MITWICCGLISCVLVVASSGPRNLRHMEFVDCMALTLLLLVMIVAGPVGLVLTLTASLIKLLSNV